MFDPPTKAASMTRPASWRATWRASPIRRVGLLIVTVGLLAFAVTRLPLTTLPERVDRLGALAPVVGVVVGALLLMALLPRTAVSLACGLLFGAPIGAACALAVTLVAAALTFAAGRWLGRDFIAHHAGRRWERIEGWIQREGVLAVAAVRALPLGPYGLLGYAYGASTVRPRHYVLGCLIAGTPSAIVYPIIGATVAGAGRINAIAAIPLTFALLLSLTLALRARRARQIVGPVSGHASAREAATRNARRLLPGATDKMNHSCGRR